MPQHFPYVAKRGRNAWAIKLGPNRWSRSFFSEEDAQAEIDRQERGVPVFEVRPAPEPVRFPPRIAPSPQTIGIDPTFRDFQSTDDVSATIGEVPPLNPDDFYWKWDVGLGEMVPARKGETGATFSNVWWAEANEARQNVDTGFPGGGTGRTGPTAAELAIQRSQVQAQNLATFITGTIAELEIEVDSKRLSTEQALGEFNRRLDAFSEAGNQFIGIQPFTIPRGSEFLPGRGPGDVGERIGRPTLEASPIDFDPFGMATDIVNQTPVLTDIGVPSGDALDEAIRIARGFLGG